MPLKEQNTIIRCSLHMTNSVSTEHRCQRNLWFFYMYRTLARRCPQVLAAHGQSYSPRSLSPILNIHHSSLPVHRQELIWPSLLSSTISVLHTCTLQCKRDVAQHHTHVMVSLITRPKPDHQPTITRHQCTCEHISITMCSQKKVLKRILVDTR
jgi:hypothetical protein